LTELSDVTLKRCTKHVELATEWGGVDSHSVLALSYDVILEGTGDWSTKHGSSTG